MEFRLLGSLEVLDGAEPIPVGGPKSRTLLAALLLDHGQVVPADRLVDAIWGDGPPETARALIQTHVAGLRRVLHQPGQPALITTRPPGYQLRTEPDAIDRYRFEHLTAQARDAAARGRHDDASETFARALALWRGPALGGIDSELLASEAARLDELHLTVLEERLSVDLVRGQHERLVSELTGLVRRHPTRETLRRQLMVALYRCDRHADALTVYRDGRQVLVDELGIEPGPALQAVHDAILRRDDAVLHEPSLPARDIAGLTGGAGTDTVGASPVATPPVPVPATHAEPLPVPASTNPAVARAPAQLPALPSDFTGRAGQIAELLRRLDHRSGAGGLPTAVIAGAGGVGKSTLAARVGHELAQAYPDGQLFVQLHGMTTTPTLPDAVLARFLAALGDPVADLPSTVEERAERYRSLVSDRRILVILDDAANEAQVRPLLPGAPTCAVLITSRSRLPGLAGAHLVELDVLPAEEARELLVRIAGAQRIEAEAEAADRLTEQCGQLPLAVRIVGTRLANRRHWSVGQLSARLEDEQRRLDELQVGDQEVRASISLSYEALDEQARTALRHLGLLGLPDFPAWIVSALLDTTEHEAQEVIERLVDGQFVDFAMTDEIGQVRYQIHDLLRLYGSERSARDDDPQTRAAAIRRVLRGWLLVVDQVADRHPNGGIALRSRSTIPSADPMPAGQTPSVAATAVSRPRLWFEVERHGLIASVERAAGMNLDDVAAELASALCSTAFSTGNLFDAWTRTHDAALSAVRRSGNRAAEASLLAEFGQLRYEQDRFAEARTYYLQALAGFREMADVRGEAATLAAIGTACRDQGYLPEALHFLIQAQALLAELADPATTTSVHRLRATVHLEQGEYAAADEDLQAALAGFRLLGSRRGEAMTLRTMGLVRRAQGDYERAYELSAQARAIFREVGDELLEAYSVRSMAKAQMRLGNGDELLTPLQDALQTCRAAGDRWGEALTLRTIGELHLAEHRLSEAREHLHAAQRLWHALDLPLARARTLRDLARLHRAGGDLETARVELGEAAEIARLYGAHEHGELVAELASYPPAQPQYR